MERILPFGGASAAPPGEPACGSPCGGPAAACAARLMLVPYFPWRFDLPEPGTFAVIAAVLLFCAWRLCRRS